MLRGDDAEGTGVIMRIAILRIWRRADFGGFSSFAEQLGR
jgi:hypothetical protein